jgi:DNA-binding IclR family transcriptional regulator
MGIDEAGREVKTTATSLLILEAIMNNGPSTIAEISDDLGLADSTAHGHIKTLEHHGFLRKDVNLYYIGFRCFHLTRHAINQHDVFRRAEGKVKELSERFPVRVDFTTEERGRIIRLFTSSNDVTHQVGEYMDMHCTAAGKAILAARSNNYIEEVIESRGLPKHTEKTIRDNSALMAEIEKIRQTGYAINDEENQIGLRAVAASVENPLGKPYGAISVAGPSYSVTDEKLYENWAPAIKEATNEVEENTEWTDSPSSR